MENNEASQENTKMHIMFGPFNTGMSIVLRVLKQTRNIYKRIPNPNDPYILFISRK